MIGILMNVLSPCLQSMLLFFCLVDAHDPKTFMSVFCTSKLSHHISIAKSFGHTIFLCNTPLNKGVLSALYHGDYKSRS
jgi:hypothetical protein